MNMRLLICSLFFVLVQSALSCPLISKIPDFNCDGEISISVIGDSLVYGTGDTKNNGKGGYVFRASKKLPNIEIENLGIPGLHSSTLASIIAKAFKDEDYENFKTSLLKADYVVFDLGRNDRWDFGEPAATLARLKSIRSSIRKKVAGAGKTPPLVVIAVLMLPNRGSQGPWVKMLDKLILDSDSNNNPANLRFDLVSKRLLSSDQIHPTSKGYDALSRQFTKYLTNILPSRALLQRKDEDDDGIFDTFEISKFGTDTTKSDTDGDGKSDGYEVFTSETNPLVVD